MNDAYLGYEYLALSMLFIGLLALVVSFWIYAKWGSIRPFLERKKIALKSWIEKKRDKNIPKIKKGEVVYNDQHLLDLQKDVEKADTSQKILKAKILVADYKAEIKVVEKELVEKQKKKAEKGSIWDRVSKPFSQREPLPTVIENPSKIHSLDDIIEDKNDSLLKNIESAKNDTKKVIEKPKEDENNEVQIKLLDQIKENKEVKETRENKEVKEVKETRENKEVKEKENTKK